MTPDEIKLFIADALGEVFGPMYRQAQRDLIDKIAHAWVADRERVAGVADRRTPDRLKVSEWFNLLSPETRWEHCGVPYAHKAHTHTIVFNEGPYPDVPCVGVPEGLAPG